MTAYLYAALLGILYMFMTIAVIKGRRSNQISLGSGESDEILHLTSAHNNFSNYVPIFLIIFCLLEKENTNVWLLHALGATFFIGRYLHFISMYKQ